MKNFKGYPLHDKTKNPKLRAWNQLHTFKAVLQDMGGEMAKRYHDQLSKTDRLSITLLVAAISKKGFEKIRKEIMV